MTLTDQHIRALAFLAADARPRGAHQWDEQGIVAALRKVAHLDLAEVMAAVANGAGDRTLEKPGALGNPTSPCWRRPADRPAPRPATVERHQRCSICSEHEATCRTRWSHDHSFQPDFRPADPAVDVPATVSGLKDLAAHAKHAVLPQPDHEPTPDPNVERLRHLAHPTQHDQREDHPA